MGSSLRTEALRLWTAVPASMPEAPALARFLADWPASAGNEAHEPAARALPVLRWLPQIAGDADRFGGDFVEALCGSAHSLDWRQTYTVTDISGRFLQNYGWAEILRPSARSGASSNPQISCGVLVLGPNTFYPPHRHEAEEIYLPLSGTAEWQQGGAVWRHRSPGTLIHHSSEELHAMRTGEHPLLAMYMWRSVDLHHKARFDRRNAE
jgi:hypothetical protein